eukprot:CAMPEP_0118711112 /NCGR_PEP_ID=MMETSP0800-20121206/23854_1 /TAXON_ID=210618 ORGANISM="Striatella unipunctata, Strain CCMP2910" /NCGR_SAMPLE_ID=MMETSP0800 /ASSEMBLY_ACC=CAM_ASM_000638 /LENGTH=229 /DNA_ID=CAMNT_0006615565 /DNA_START=37 /DNA_END=726 /DNA_ORIENTATION=+
MIVSIHRSMFPFLLSLLICLSSTTTTTLLVHAQGLPEFIVHGTCTDLLVLGNEAVSEYSRCALESLNDYVGQYGNIKYRFGKVTHLHSSQKETDISMTGTWLTRNGGSWRANYRDDFPIPDVWRRRRRRLATREKEAVPIKGKKETKTTSIKTTITTSTTTVKGKDPSILLRGLKGGKKNEANDEEERPEFHKEFLDKLYDCLSDSPDFPSLPKKRKIKCSGYTDIIYY